MPTHSPLFEVLSPYLGWDGTPEVARITNVNYAQKIWNKAQFKITFSTSSKLIRKIKCTGCDRDVLVPRNVTGRPWCSKCARKLRLCEEEEEE